jgi:hypothetical protein
MDRLSKVLFALCCSLCVLLITAGCATVPAESDGHFSEPDTITLEAVTEPDADVGEHAAQTVAVPLMPDVSLPAPSPTMQGGSAATAAVDRESGEIPDPSGMADEFHLSAVTGWLVLPVPRITDDLPLQVAPSELDAVSGLPLILPSPPAFTMPASVDAAHVDTGGDDDAGGRDIDTGRANSAVSPGVSIPSIGVIEPPDEAVVQVEESAVVGTAVAGRSPQVQSPPPGGETQRPAAITSGASTEPIVDGGAGTLVVPGETEWSQRSAAVDSGGDVVVTLPGTGWLYVGREYGVGIADLMTKRTVGGDDEFVFQFSENGDYGLWFQRQDAATGRISNERLEVAASPGGNTQVSVGSLAGALPSESTGLVDESGLSALHAREPGIDGDLTDDAVVESEPGPVEWMALALEAAAQGNVPVAAEYFRRIAASGGVDAQLARASMFELGLAQIGGSGMTDPELLVAAVDALRDAGELDRGSLLEAAETAERAELYGNAAAFYTELSEWGPSVDGMDRIYFRLAEILTRPGPARDLVRARSLYEAVIDRYPLSKHWDDSASRVEHLDRHYFEVR